MVRGRAYRLAQKDRILKKRKNHPRNESDLVNNPKRCSCYMCRNPRRNKYLKQKEKITIAERKFNEKFNSEIQEIENESN